jgi:hypothetical protein
VLTWLVKDPEVLRGLFDRASPALEVPNRAYPRGIDASSSSSSHRRRVHALPPKDDTFAIRAGDFGSPSHAEHGGRTSVRSTRGPRLLRALLGLREPASDVHLWHAAPFEVARSRSSVVTVPARRPPLPEGPAPPRSV